jgi:GNAT superfamily N-acetyltransferase
MALASWWHGEPLPLIPALPGFHAAQADDDAMLAQLNHISIEEVRARRQDDHRPYVGYLDGTPVVYGWVATRAASIGELDVTLTLTSGDRYLWDFATIPAWQGRGLYPRLLQAILRQESHEAERFWIIYAPENLPSGAGMRKAGFTPTAELSFDADQHVRLTALGAYDRAQVAAELLGVPLVTDELAPCWCCQQSEPQASDEAACWPPQPDAGAVCTCAIERRSFVLTPA